MTQNSKWYGKWLDVQADRDRLAARVRELEAALRWYADEIPAEYEIYAGGTYLCAVSWISERARAALADSGAAEQEA